MLIPAKRGAARARVADAVRGTRAGSFAVVMATGIVSAALRAAGRPHLSAAALAIAAAGGLIRTRPGAVVAITAWAAGALIYLVITVLVAIRLAVAGLGRPNPTAPYWVAMGAASITVLAAAQILRGSGPAALGAARPWPEEDPVIMTVTLMADDPGKYFEVGDSFAFRLGPRRRPRGRDAPPVRLTGEAG